MNYSLRILEEDLKKGYVKLRLDTLDDLYWLMSILEPGDMVTMRTTRRIKQDGIRANSGERVVMTLTLGVEKVKMDQYASRLRITGVVREGPEKFGIQGQHHTLNVTEGSVISIMKNSWSKAHLDILKKAEESSMKGKALLVVMDDEGATVAKADAYRVEEITYLVSNIPSKRGELKGRQDAERKYYAELSNLLEELDSQIGSSAIIVGGPGFSKEKFIRYIKEKKPHLADKVREGGASSATFSGIIEMIRRGDLDKVVKELTLSQDMKLVEEIFEYLARNSRLVTYGLKEVKRAVEYGAAESVLVASSLLFNMETRNDILYILEKCKETRASFHIIDSKSEPGEKLLSLGGIAAKLRFQVS